MIRTSSGAVRRWFVVLATTLALAGCGGGDDDGRVNTGNADEVMNNVLVRIGGVAATQQSGSPPQPTGTADSPKALAGSDPMTMTASAGSTVDIPVSFQASAVMTSIFAKVGNATTYFQASNPIGGKFAKAVPVSGAGQNFVITVELTADFEPGQFCIAINGIDAGGRVSNVDAVCIRLVDSITPTAQDQPTAAALATALEGNWLSNCQAFQTADRSGSAKVGFTFGTGQTYTQFIDIWDVPNCPGNPNSAVTVVNGTVQIGQAPVFVPTGTSTVVGFWATPIDFLPDAASTALGAHPCFNLLRFVNDDPADRFFLGVPLGFSLTGEEDSPAPCASVATRPTYLNAAVQFTPVDTLPPLNQAPVANAGPDQGVNPGAVVTLNSSASSDADGTITRQWSQTAGTTVVLSSTTAVSPTFTAPASNSVLTFLLTVTDNGGATATDTVTITVAANNAPTANAGPDLVRQTSTTVQLAGSGTDVEGPVTFAWTQTAGTPTVTLSNANTVTASFTAPATATDLTFQLAVTDDEGVTTTDTVVVHVVNSAPPTANAGPDQSVKIGNPVTLQGSGSDADGIDSFSWTQVTGTPVTLSDASAQNPTFTAPASAGTLVFRLVVTDNVGLTSTPDETQVTVHTNFAPTADAGPTQRFAEIGDTVTISGAGSDDPDGTIVSFLWDQIGGDVVNLQGEDTDTLTFVMPNTAHDDFTFELTVTDDEGATDTDTVIVTRLAPFKLSFSTVGFEFDSKSFEFRIQGNHTIGNLFTDQSNVQPFPEGAVFNDLIVDNGNCAVSPISAATVECNDDFVARYLGSTIDGCDVDTTSTAIITTASNATSITFNVDCAGASVVNGNGEVGIGLNGGEGPLGNHQARSNQTGHDDAVTNSCSANGCDQT
jgi:hypothetical protein